MSKIERLVVPHNCHDATTWNTAFAEADRIRASITPPVSEYILLTHAKALLKDTALAKYLGEKVCSELSSNKVVTTASGAQVRHATLTKPSNPVANVVIIACYADAVMMDKIDDLNQLQRVVGVVVVPGQLNGIIDWCNRWPHHVYGGSQIITPNKLIADRVIENAMISLTGRVNLTNSVMLQRDTEHATDTFKILRAKSHILDGGEIRSWAIQNGWRLNAADDLKKLADKASKSNSVTSLKKIQNADAIYANWS